jgi:hypothetical protein
MEIIVKLLITEGIIWLILGCILLGWIKDKIPLSDKTGGIIGLIFTMSTIFIFITFMIWLWVI